MSSRSSFSMYCRHNIFTSSALMPVSVYISVLIFILRKIKTAALQNYRAVILLYIYQRNSNNRSAVLPVSYSGIFVLDTPAKCTSKFSFGRASCTLLENFSMRPALRCFREYIGLPVARHHGTLTPAWFSCGCPHCVNCGWTEVSLYPLAFHRNMATAGHRPNDDMHGVYSQSDS